MTKRSKPPASGPPAYIFRASITLPSGEVIFARDYGLKAFRIAIRTSKSTKPPLP
jgi:hypothetical protein